jgi:hypothetical protein
MKMKALPVISDCVRAPAAFMADSSEGLFMMLAARSEASMRGARLLVFMIGREMAGKYQGDP